MAKSPKPELDEATRQIAKRMLRMPPKRHDDMKAGKRKRQAKTAPTQKRVTQQDGK